MSSIFISGYNVTEDYWNFGKNNNNINIQQKIQKKTKNISVIITPTDYDISFIEYADIIHHHIQTQKCVVPYTFVAHSLGSMYIFAYILKYNPPIKKLILLDVTLHHNFKIKDWTQKSINDMTYHKLLKYLREIPVDLSFISPYTKVIAYLNDSIKTKAKYTADLDYLSCEKNKNNNIKIIVYNNVGHMIHWKRPVELINEILL